MLTLVPSYSEDLQVTYHFPFICLKHFQTTKVCCESCDYLSLYHFNHWFFWTKLVSDCNQCGIIDKN